MLFVFFLRCGEVGVDEMGLVFRLMYTPACVVGAGQQLAVIVAFGIGISHRPSS